MLLVPGDRRREEGEPRDRCRAARSDPALRLGVTRTRRSTATRRRLAALAAAAALTTAACSGSVVHSYRTFQSAVDRGASCSELFDQRARLSGEARSRADADLSRIGCSSPQATRTDR